MKTLKKIEIDDLVCMNDKEDAYGFRIDLAYAKDNNLLFGERIYRPEAELYLHKDLAEIVCRAASDCLKTHGLRFLLYDGLRTTDAQKRIMQTRRVQENPHWLQEPRLLSPPGTGGHPRGMAIDIGLETLDGVLLDMGTPFDYLAENSDEAHNPAHRNYAWHTHEILENRGKLDKSLLKSAESLKRPLVLLPQEWWDFRLPAEIYNQYAPLSDTDLPPSMQLI